jgi:hypothetical protein
MPHAKFVGVERPCAEQMQVNPDWALGRCMPTRISPTSFFKTCFLVPTIFKYSFVYSGNAPASILLQNTACLLCCLARNTTHRDTKATDKHAYKRRGERSSNGASFIPDQPDPLGLAVTEAVRHEPFTLALRDLFTVIRMFTLLGFLLLARARRSGVAVAVLASSHRFSVNRLLLWWGRHGPTT